ncbi:hypothetical protein GYMLUDRAFT_39708 [Collybiopsis luxurians FD-317 M1]|nr:hypothetical protein GYMLUDRAFT_39708 [Collybiopsis luxurians FD-317 M1]
MAPPSQEAMSMINRAASVLIDQVAQRDKLLLTDDISLRSWTKAFALAVAKYRGVVRVLTKDRLNDIVFTDPPEVKQALVSADTFLLKHTHWTWDEDWLDTRWKSAAAERKKIWEAEERRLRRLREEKEERECISRALALLDTEVLVSDYPTEEEWEALRRETGADASADLTNNNTNNPPHTHTQPQTQPQFPEPLAINLFDPIFDPTEMGITNSPITKCSPLSYLSDSSPETCVDPRSPRPSASSILHSPKIIDPPSFGNDRFPTHPHGAVPLASDQAIHMESDPEFGYGNGHEPVNSASTPLITTTTTTSTGTGTGHTPNTDRNSPSAGIGPNSKAQAQTQPTKPSSKPATQPSSDVSSGRGPTGGSTRTSRALSSRASVAPTTTPVPPTASTTATSAPPTGPTPPTAKTGTGTGAGRNGGTGISGNNNHHMHHSTAKPSQQPPPRRTQGILTVATSTPAITLNSNLNSNLKLDSVQISSPSRRRKAPDTVTDYGSSTGTGNGNGNGNGTGNGINGTGNGNGISGFDEDAIGDDDYEDMSMSESEEAGGQETEYENEEDYLKRAGGVLIGSGVLNNPPCTPCARAKQKCFRLNAKACCARCYQEHAKCPLDKEKPSAGAAQGGPKAKRHKASHAT